VVVLIDSWGFTVRVAEGLKRRAPGLPLVKYVAPQVWAHHPGRAKSLARVVDHLLTIHAFEPPFFEAAGLPTTCVGNSVLRWDISGADAAALRAEIGAGPDDPILLLLPGSRPSEINRMLGPLETAADLLRQGQPDLKVVVIAADTVAEAVKTRVAGWRRRAHVIEGDAGKLNAMAAATVAIACSGTVTTELAIVGCPMVIGYRLGPMTHFLAKFLIRTPYVALINIAAQAFIAPELIQDRCNGPDLAREAARLLDSPDARAAQVAAQHRAIDSLGRGGPDPSEAAAEAVLKVVEERRGRAIAA
jgi:lipid-A-disaccharide synthase